MTFLHPTDQRHHIALTYKDAKILPNDGNRWKKVKPNGFVKRESW